MTEVRHLRIRHPRLSPDREDPFSQRLDRALPHRHENDSVSAFLNAIPNDSVDIDIPWDHLPDSMRQTLENLDTNHDGTLTYSPSLSQQQSGTYEIRNDDRSAATLSRLFWAYSGGHPHNNRIRDRETQATRESDMNRLHQSMRSVVETLAFDTTRSHDPERWPEQWNEAQRLWELTANSSGLLSLGQSVFDEARARRDQNDLYQAEQLFLSAFEFASQIPAHYDSLGPLGYDQNGTPTVWGPIDRALQEINPLLDEIEQREFTSDIQHPYLMSSLGSPVTAEVDDVANGFSIPFSVAVPTSVIAHLNEHERDTFLRNYFNNVAQVRVQDFPSPTAPTHRLIVDKIEWDQPTSLDDPTSETFSPHVTQRTLNENLFHQEMTYFRVSFTFEHPDQALTALGSRGTRKLDVILNRPENRNNIRRHRVIEGGFVLQNTLTRPTKTAFVSDPHVSERDSRILSETLRHLSEDLLAHPDNRQRAEEIDRLYQSATERVLAAVELWNDAYRRGELDRVMMTGDLVDFVNVAETLQRQGYRSSNVRRLVSVLSHIHAPTYVVSGNHDHHAFPYPISVECRSLRRAESLCDLYEDHYDRFHFAAPLLLNGITALLPSYFNLDIEAPIRVATQAYRTNPYANQDDTTLDHHLQHVGIYQNYGLRLGRTMIFMGEAGAEDFSFLHYLSMRTSPPRRTAVQEATDTYINGRLVNARSLLQQEFTALIREVLAARSRGDFVIPALHYPMMASGHGPDGTPHNADTLRDEASRAFRLLTWHCRHPNGDPVIPMFIAGHTHTYEETDFELYFSTPQEEAEVHAEVESILTHINEQNMDHIYRDLDAVWTAHSISSHMRIRSTTKPGSEGIPTLLAQEFQNASRRPQRTLSVNLPALGPESIYSGNGYMVLTSTPEGHLSYEMRLVYTRPDGLVTEFEGSQRNDYLANQENDIHNWDPNFSFVKTTILTQPSPIQQEDNYPVSSPSRLLEFFPTICSYTQGDVCLNTRLWTGLDLAPGASFLFRLSSDIQLPLRIGVTPRNIITAVPNYLYAGFSWDPNFMDMTHGSVSVYGGTGHGLFETLIGGRLNYGTDQWIGEAGIATHWGLPSLPSYFGALPNIFFTIGHNFDSGENAGTVGLRWDIPTLSVYRDQRSQQHFPGQRPRQ